MKHPRHDHATREMADYRREFDARGIHPTLFGAEIITADGRAITPTGTTRASDNDTGDEQTEAKAQRARDLEFLQRRREQAPAPAPAPQRPRQGEAGARIVAAAKANPAPLTPQEQAQRDLEAIRLSRGAVQRQADAAVERARRIATGAGARIVGAARTRKGAA